MNGNALNEAQKLFVQQTSRSGAIDLYDFARGILNLSCEAPRHDEHAFPLVVTQGTTFSQPGMSLRDYFAGQALAGLLTERSADDRIAVQEYEMADAMMTQRAKAGTDA